MTATVLTRLDAATEELAAAPSGAVTQIVPAAPRRARLGRADLVLFVAVAAARAAYGSVADRPRISFDEPSQLAIARLLSGRGTWFLSHAPLYHPGLGTLLAPVNFLTGDPVLVYRSAIALNAIFAACSALLLVRIASHLAIASARFARVASGLICLAPAVVPLSAFAWSDPAITFTFLAAVLCSLRAVDDARPGWAYGAVLAASAGFLFHVRMLPALAVVSLGAVGWCVYRRWWAHAVSLAVLAGATWFGVRVYSSWLVGRLWDDASSTNTADTVLGKLGDPWALIRSAVGQAWYQGVAWLGFSLLGGVVLVAAVCGRTRVGLARRHAMVLLVLVLPMIATSVVFMSGRLGRADYLVYGRYNDDVVWPLVLVAAAELYAWRSHPRLLLRWAGVTVAGLLLLTVALEWSSGTQVRSLPALFPMVSGVVAFSGYSAVEPAVIGIVAVGVIALVFGSWARRDARPALLVGLLAVLALAGNARTFVDTARHARSSSSTDAIASVSTVVPPGQPIGYRLSFTGYFVDPILVATLAQAYQFALPQHDLVVVDDFDDPPEFTLSVRGDPLLVDQASIVWSDSSLPHVVWRLDEP